VRFSRLCLVAISAAVTVGLLGVGYEPVAAASCAGPSIAVGSSVDPARPPSTGTLHRDTDTVVSGLFFHQGCEDTGVPPGPGCRPAPPADPQSPMSDVELTLVQGDRTWILGAADAADRDRLYAITWTVSVPADTRTGAALLRAASASLPVQIG
jgi:hypothetical protein